jgi:nitrogen fixation-related uncharacterized protein
MVRVKSIFRAIGFAAIGLLIASPAYAHDAVAGEELAGAQEILIVSMILLIIGLVICFYAWRHGQFTDIEEPKYTMLRSESELDYACIEDADDEDERLIAAHPLTTPGLPVSAPAQISAQQLRAQAPLGKLQGSKEEPLWTQARFNPGT